MGREGGSALEKYFVSNNVLICIKAQVRKFLFEGAVILIYDDRLN